MDKRTDLWQSIFDSLIDDQNSELLPNLAKIICKLLDKDKDGVYYFSMPIWNYINNCWEKSTIVRINKKNDDAYGPHETGWAKEQYDKYGSPSNSFKKSTYNIFFSEAGKNFSFIEFFTQHVKTIAPIFKIEYNTDNTLSYNSQQSLLKFPKDHSNLDRTCFIKVAKSLLTNDTLQKEDEKKLNDFCTFLIEYCNNFKELTHIYLISSRLYKYNNDAYIGSGGIILVCKKEIDDSILQQISILTNLCYRELGGKNWAERSKIETIKSAKAAIMSRNMSHNLGSHVMFYIKQKLESVDTILQTGVLEDLVKSKSLEEIRKKIENQISINDNLPMPFLVGLGRFLVYLQERQDYIATVATDYIPYKSTINFKDAIYDELKPELRAKRHQNDFSFSKSKQAANLLFDFIAYSEGFHSSDKIELWFENFNGGTEPDDVPPKLRDFNVAIPSGTMGRQAFFSIMENIIRNTAKHDGAKLNGGNLKFRFDILNDEIKTNDEQEQDINKKFSLNIKSWTNEAAYSSDSITEKYKKHLNNFHFLGITIDLGIKVNDDDKVFNDLKEGLKRNYLYAERMDDSYKGIKEIRISAAWLRGYGLDTYIPSDEPPAVAIRNNNGHLQYIVCLPKPKKVAFISNEAKDLDAKGYQTFSRSEIEKHTKEIADFELIVCKQEDYSVLNKYVGARFLIVDTDYTDKEISIIYFEWLKQFFNVEKLPKLVINDEKASDNSCILKKCWEEYCEDMKNFLGLAVVCNSSDSVSNQIVFSKHYSGQQELKEMYKNACFLEGISGGNSTDRLIRRTPWTMEWYVKLMTAALTKVAVFDERIYSCFVKQGDSQFAEWNEKKLEEWLKEVKKEVESSALPIYRLQNLVKKGIGYDVNVEQTNILLENNSNKYVISQDTDKRKQFLQILHKSDIPTDSSMATLYSQKGIYAFDIIANEIEKKVTIVGYSDEEGRVCEIATLNNKIEWEPDIPYFFKGKFHFVSIHQGILDKIYGCLGAKDNNAKIKITNQFYNAFMCEVHIKKYFNVENDSALEFLPRLIIHSGRSKPNNNDMPQKQPFIQFAALDYAIKDCKYSLTELLYSAHYE